MHNAQRNDINKTSQNFMTLLWNRTANQKLVYKFNENFFGMLKSLQMN